MGQVSILGGCRSRSSYRLVSCSSLEFSHMLENLSGMMSQKKNMLISGQAEMCDNVRPNVRGIVCEGAKLA